MEVFLARQPIFDKDLKVYAYELLFRSSLDNYFSHPSRDHASSKVIADSFLLFDPESLTGGEKAFINVTADVLLKEFAILLPKHLTVLEILENVNPDEAVLAACNELKKSGYSLALDDFVYEDKYRPLVELADFIKVDFLESDPARNTELVKQFGHKGIKFLAEKVETKEIFDQALSMGYEYFQGFFFSKPVIVTNRDVSPYKLHYLRVLQEIHKPEINFSRLETIVKQDVSMSYKLLRYINSPFFGTRFQIHSIQQALMLLGEKEIRKWATLVALATMADNKPLELVVHAIIRAGICEALAEKAGKADQGQDLFLMGMFSLIDAIMDRPIDDVLKDMPIASEVKDALLGKANWHRKVLETVLSYEQADWNGFSECCADLNLEEKEFPQLYLEAIKWAQGSFSNEALGG